MSAPQSNVSATSTASSAQSTTTSSAASTKSENGAAITPVTTAKGTSSSSQQMTPAAAPANGDAKRSASVPRKPTMSSRISGIFGRRDANETAKDSSAHERTGDTIKEEASSKRSPVTAANPPTALASNALTPVATRPNAAQVNGSQDKSAEKKADEHGTPRRFWIKEDGSHEHFLKVAKRNQKLKDMVRGLWDRKKDGHEEQPLTLMHDWIMQKRSESKAASDLNGGPNSSQSLLEKYGKCQEIVGHGAFGIVRVAHKTDSRDPKKEQLFAVKEFHKRPGESAKKYQKRLTSEFCISSSMEHPNVIHTLDLLQDDKGDYCEVMEYCTGGDLYTLILSAGNLEVVEADCYFKQLMRGVEYMHEMGVAHRDLKPENLLLTQHGCLKITDFGNGECFRMAWEKEAHMTAGLCGSAPYIAPEEYHDKEFDPRAVDMWACGVIYMAMRTGRHLWRVAQKGEDEFFTRYLEDRKEESGFRPIEILRRHQCRNVIYSILDPNPVRRLTAHQVLQSEWVQEIKICSAGEEGF